MKELNSFSLNMEFIDDIVSNISEEKKIKLYILKGIQLGIRYGNSKHIHAYQSIIDRELKGILHEKEVPTPLSMLEKRKKEILQLLQSYSHSMYKNTVIFHTLKFEFVRIMKEIEKIR
jgi:hypothetical protein